MEQIICFGDSNTYGAHGFQGGRYGEEIRWCSRLAADEAFAGKYEFFNMGENGRGIPEDDWEMDYVCRQMARHRPLSLLVIMLGTNDLLMTIRTGMDGVVTQMDRFLAHLLRYSFYPENDAPQVQSSLLQGPEQILLIAPPPTHLSGYGREGVRFDRLSLEFGSAYRALAAKTGCHFADAGSWQIETGPDGVHFTRQGHIAFAQGMRQSLLEILQAKAPGPIESEDR